MIQSPLKNERKMSKLSDIFREAVISGLTSQTMTSCSRWAEHRRIMGEPFPGPYSFDHHPWCKEIHDSDTTYNVAMKAAQMGITEVAINRAFYTVDVLRSDVLYVLPTLNNASDFAKARFNTALLHSSYLKNIFTSTNTVGLKQANGVNLYIRGSRGDANLKSIPVSTLILDELNEMSQKQVWLALERLSGHINKKIWAISTPTVPKYGIDILYEQGTKEHFVFKCPHCGKFTELVWPDCVEIHGETVSDPKCMESYLKCKECGHKLEHETKNEWLNLKNAHWEPTENNNFENRSFQINQLYSFTVTPGEIVVGHFRGMGDEAALVEFNNSKLGLPYIPAGGLVTNTELEAAVRNYSKNDDRPKVGGQRCICMGVDVGKLNHIVVAEYIFDRYSNDLNAAAFAKLLWEGTVPGEDFTELDRMMREWQIISCVIDADPFINDARRFARRFHGYVTLCRYRKGTTGKELQISEEDTGSPMATCDRTNWLDAALGRFHSGRISLPCDISLTFQDHIKNLVRTFIKDDVGNPRAVYLNTGADHFAHALCYAEIALPLGASIVSGKDIGSFL
jgi:Phage terminase large subunit gpA, ATPase domain/Terminase large subunit gpA, endonuclease domain